MINLITLQTFDGSWDLSKNLAAILRKSVDDLTNTIPDSRLVCFYFDLFQVVINSFGCDNDVNEAEIAK